MYVRMYVHEWIKNDQSLGSEHLEWCPYIKDLYGALNMKTRVRMSYPNRLWVASLLDPFVVPSQINSCEWTYFMRTKAKHLVDMINVVALVEY